MARPLSPAYQNSALAELQDLRNRYGSMDRYLDRAVVQCKVQANNSIYVSAEGYVLPCCWFAGQLRNPVLRTPAEILNPWRRSGTPLTSTAAAAAFARSWRMSSFRAGSRQLEQAELRGRQAAHLRPGLWPRYQAIRGPEPAEPRSRPCGSRESQLNQDI